MIINKMPPVERKADGSLPIMSAKQRSHANTLIRQTCSYYDGGNCLYLDRGESTVCVQSISYSVLCKYFWHILLETKEGRTLKAQLLHSENIKNCLVCGKAFHPQSNRVKYCNACAATTRRSQKAAHARKRRRK